MNWESAATAVSTADVQEVWDILLDGRRWSFWNPGIEWMWIEGELAAGTLATVKFRGVRQTAALIDQCAPPRRFALRLTVGPVARLTVTWTLHETPPSGTRIEGLVAIAGIAAGPLLRSRAQRLALALPGSLERLAAWAATPPAERAREERAVIEKTRDSI